MNEIHLTDDFLKKSVRLVSSIMNLLKNSLYSLIGMLLPTLLAIVTVPLYISRIGSERYGALAIAWLALGYFGQADFGIGRAVTQRISKIRELPRADQAVAVWSALASIVPVSIIGSFLLYITTWSYFSGPFKIEIGIRIELLRSIWALSLCYPVVTLIGVLSGTMIGLGKFRLVSFSNALSNGCMLLFPLVAAYQFSIDLEALVVASLIARFLGAIVLAVGVWRAVLSRERVSATLAEMLHLARFGSWVMVTALVGPFMLFADRFVIGIALDAAAVAAYSIPYQIATRTLIIPNSITQALFPQLASAGEPHSREVSRQVSVFVGQIFAPLVIVLICCSAPLMHLWLGARLDPRSVVVAWIILAGVWANAVATVPFAYIQARGAPRFTAVLHLVELPCYIVMLYVLGINFGLPGLAAAFALRCLIDCLALLYRAGTADSRTLLGLGSPAVLVLLAIAGGRRVETWPGALAASALLCSLALIVTLWQLPDLIRHKLHSLGIIRSWRKARQT